MLEITFFVVRSPDVRDVRIDQQSNLLLLQITKLSSDCGWSTRND
jgi:hypothetical protein